VSTARTTRASKGRIVETGALSPVSLFQRVIVMPNRVRGNKLTGLALRGVRDRRNPATLIGEIPVRHVQMRALGGHGPKIQ
jgi:hypothetical protein